MAECDVICIFLFRVFFVEDEHMLSLVPRLKFRYKLHQL